MKRVFLLLTFIGVLFASPEGFAKPPKHITKTIKYENGDKYVGTIQIWKFNGKKKKYRHGDGIMYYANGNRFEGTWGSDVPIYGTVYYANGNLFKGSLEYGTPYRGQFVFANQGFIKLGDKLWKYSDNSSFKGDFIDGKIYTGQFDCPLTTTTGDRFTGTIKSGELDKGTIVFANGDSFEGSFNSSAPSTGKYCYGREIEIVGAAYKWTVPAGCTFDGDVRTLTGTVDTKITDINGNQFIGKLAVGLPDEGTMSFANSTTETGKWQDGMSPSEYKTYLARQEAERKRQEVEEKRQKVIKDRKDLKEFEKQVQNRIDPRNIYDYWSISLDLWGNEIANGAYLKLKQLYLNKTIICEQTSKKYVCTDMQYQSKYIEMTIKSPEGRSKKLYIECIKISRRPSIEINRTYPDDWPYVYYKVDAVEDTERIGYVSFYLADDNYENTISRLYNHWARKFGNYWASIIINKEFKLGMTVEMVEAIKGKGSISRDISAGGEVVYLSYGYTTSFVFVNGKLKKYTLDE